MERYTVLLVDDEEEVIQVIMRKINWEELGFSVIGYANNGVKALEMVEEFQPDVVMTDIKMPYMDGMELAKHIKAELPATKILLFTGFDEFEYAKEAVHLEVEEYVLKPLNAVELTNVFSKMKEKLDQEIKERRSVEILQKYYMESLPFLQADFCSALIEGRVQKDEVRGYLTNCQLSFEGPFFCCLVIHTSSSHVPENMTPMLLATSVQKQADERLGERWKGKSFAYLGNTILITQLENENDVSELTDECDRFCRYAKRMIGADVTIGIGQVCGNILELTGSYGSAREAVSYRVIYGDSRAINMKEIAPQEMSRSGDLNAAEFTKLFKMIRMGSESNVIEEAGRCLRHIVISSQSLPQHHIAVMELISAFYRFYINNEIELKEFAGDMQNLYSNIIDMNPNALLDWIIHISLAFREQLTSARSKSTRSFVQKAKEYVYNNYADEELSLDNVCEILGVSNSYFSTIFKKETGNSFIGYLTDYRMERAARLLMETNEKSYIIAKKVGYTDPNYFSYVFKRKYGASPSKYRTEHTEGEK